MSPKRSEGWIISNVESDVYCGMLTLLAYDDFTTKVQWKLFTSVTFWVAIFWMFSS